MLFLEGHITCRPLWSGLWILKDKPQNLHVWLKITATMDELQTVNIYFNLRSYYNWPLEQNVLQQRSFWQLAPFDILNLQGGGRRWGLGSQASSGPKMRAQSVFHLFLFFVFCDFANFVCTIVAKLGLRYGWVYIFDSSAWQRKMKVSLHSNICRTLQEVAVSCRAPCLFVWIVCNLTIVVKTPRRKESWSFRPSSHWTRGNAIWRTNTNGTFFCEQGGFTLDASNIACTCSHPVWIGPSGFLRSREKSQDTTFHFRFQVWPHWPDSRIRDVNTHSTKIRSLQFSLWIEVNIPES